MRCRPADTPPAAPNAVFLRPAFMYSLPRFAMHCIGSCADLSLLPFQPLRLGLGGPHACVDPGKVLIEVRPQKAVGRLPLVQLIVFRIICHIFYISSPCRDTPLSAARPNPDSLQPCLEIPSTKCLPPEALKPFWFQGLSPFSLSGLSTKCLPSKPFHAVTEFFR